MPRLSRPALLLLLVGLSASALAKAPETVNIGYQKLISSRCLNIAAPSMKASKAGYRRPLD